MAAYKSIVEGCIQLYGNDKYSRERKEAAINQICGCFISDNKPAYFYWYLCDFVLYMGACRGNARYSELGGACDFNF